MRMPIVEMYEKHSMVTLVHAVQGYTRKRYDTFKGDWERARWLAYHFVGSIAGVDEATPDEWIRFPWEEKKKPLGRLKTKEDVDIYLKGG